jgi:hypothetical protein
MDGRGLRLPRPPIKGKYASLLACLVSLPLFEALSLGVPALECLYWLAFLTLLFVGLVATDPGRRSIVDELLLVVPAAIALLTLPLLGAVPRQHASAWIAFRHAAGLLALGALGFRILRDVLHVRCVVFDQVCGGLCFYVILGFAFALIYSALERLRPGSFVIDQARFGLTDPDEYLHHLRSLMTYFSFITLTTLGFGDIGPALDLPRALVAAQAVIGQIYLAVFVARLVSLNLATGSVSIQVDPEPRPGVPPPHRPPPPRTGVDTRAHTS